MISAAISHPGPRSNEEASLSVLIGHLEEVVAVVLVAVGCPAPAMIVKQQRDRGSVVGVEMQRHMESIVACHLKVGALIFTRWQILPHPSPDPQDLLVCYGNHLRT